MGSGCSRTLDRGVTWPAQQIPAGKSSYTTTTPRRSDDVEERLLRCVLGTAHSVDLSKAKPYRVGGRKSCGHPGPSRQPRLSPAPLRQGLSVTADIGKRVNGGRGSTKHP